MVAFLVSIVPSAGALFLFVVALRAILHADRRERAAMARYEASHGPLTAAPPAVEGDDGETDAVRSGRS